MIGLFDIILHYGTILRYYCTNYIIAPIIAPIMAMGS
jgi:hypothetical protein